MHRIRIANEVGQYYRFSISSTFCFRSFFGTNMSNLACCLLSIAYAHDMLMSWAKPMPWTINTGWKPCKSTCGRPRKLLNTGHPFHRCSKSTARTLILLWLSIFPRKHSTLCLVFELEADCATQPELKKQSWKAQADIFLLLSLACT